MKTNGGISITPNAITRFLICCGPVLNNLPMSIKIFRIALLAALLFFSWLMLLITLQYIPARPDVAFLRIKQEVAGMWHYQLAFFIHVYSSMFALTAGLTQF